MSAHKIDHKELQKRLKEDELDLFVHELRDKSYHVYNTYGRQIGLVIALVVVIAIGIYFWNMKQRTDFVDSQLLFSHATTLLQQDMTTEAIQSLSDVINNYSGTEIALSARILRGNAYAKNEQYDLAIQDYKQVLPKLDPIDSIPVNIALAQAYRSVGRADEALEELNALESKVTTKEMKNEIYFIQGECYEDLGQNQQALEAYKNISKDTGWQMLARERIDWLQQEPVSAINP